MSLLTAFVLFSLSSSVRLHLVAAEFVYLVARSVWTEGAALAAVDVWAEQDFFQLDSATLLLASTSVRYTLFVCTVLVACTTLLDTCH